MKPFSAKGTLVSYAAHLLSESGDKSHALQGAETPICSYENSEGETVSWELAEVFAVESFAPKDSGDEVIGFIASIQELEELT